MVVMTANMREVPFFIGALSLSVSVRKKRCLFFLPIQYYRRLLFLLLVSSLRGDNRSEGARRSLHVVLPVNGARLTGPQTTSTAQPQLVSATGFSLPRTSTKKTNSATTSAALPLLLSSGERSSLEKAQSFPFLFIPSLPNTHHHRRRQLRLKTTTTPSDAFFSANSRTREDPQAAVQRSRFAQTQRPEKAQQGARGLWSGERGSLPEEGGKKGIRTAGAVSSTLQTKKALFHAHSRSTLFSDGVLSLRQVTQSRTQHAAPSSSSGGPSHSCLSAVSPSSSSSSLSAREEENEESDHSNNVAFPSKLERLQKSRDHVSQPVAQMLLEDMLLGRTFEDMCAQMYYRGKVAGFVHLYNGQEAVSTGVLKTLRPDDYCVSTYRDHVHAVSKGVSAREVFAELYGKQTGCSRGRGGSMHMFSKKHGMVGGFAYIGEQVPVALGFAYSSAYRRFAKQTSNASASGDGDDDNKTKDAADQVTVCFTGDGSTNMGQFYEALNIAAVAKLPIIFVVENNNWAIGMAHYRSTSVPEIYKKAEGFGIPGVEVDGMDVLAVRKAARAAVERARRGEGPTLIEALTYRFRGHSLADPDELRSQLERKAWAERDPITSFGEYMKQMGYATDDSLKLTKRKIREIVDDAVRFAETSGEPSVEDIGMYVFGEHYVPTGETFTADQLKGYAKALEAELDYQDRRKSGDKSPPEPVQMTQEPLVIID